MNGQELMEALSYVDEEYVAAADKRPVRRIHWQPFAAAAACLILVLAGVWQYLPQPQTKEAAQEDAAPMVMASGSARSSQEMDAGNGAAVMMASPFVQMTVQVLEWTEEGACCQVVDPMNTGYEAGQELTVVLPEATEAYLPSPASPDSADAPVYRVSFLMTEETHTITAAQWTQEEQN